jgi:hypothetical protein
LPVEVLLVRVEVVLGEGVQVREDVPKVDLPAPLSPINAVTSPARAWQDAPRKASTEP